MNTETAFIGDPAFIRTQASGPRHLFRTRHLLEKFTVYMDGCRTLTHWALYSLDQGKLATQPVKAFHRELPNGRSCSRSRHRLECSI